MKKLTILFILISGFMFSQEFVITPENYKNKVDETKNFIVLEFENKTKDELFKKVKSYIISNYKGIKNDGYNEIENEQIVVDIDKDRKFGGFQRNRYEINFKDGKMMIKPYFNYIQDSQGKKIFLTGGNFIIVAVFNKEGKIRTQSFKENIEENANSFVLEIKNSINTNSDW